MKKIIHLLLLLASGQSVYSSTPSPELRARMETLENSNNQHQTSSPTIYLDENSDENSSAVKASTNLSASSATIKEQDNLEKLIYVGYKDEKDEPLAFTPQAIKLCPFLKAQHKLDPAAGTSKNPLLITKELLSGFLLEDLNNFLNIIISANGNSSKIQKTLRQNLESQSKEKIIDICKAASYLAIDPLKNACIELMQEYASKNFNDKKFITDLKTLDPIAQKLITPKIIYAHPDSYSIIAKSLPRAIQDLNTYGNNAIWSFDGQQLAIAKAEFLHILNPKNGAVIRTMKGHTRDITSITWSPDGTRLASSSLDRTVRIWNAQTGSQTHKLTGHTRRIFTVKWSPDNTRLASASLDKTIRIWDAKTGAQMGTPLIGSDWANLISWSPDGIKLASFSGKNILIWDAQLCELIQNITAHDRWITSMNWSPDGTKLASSSEDKTIRIWNAQSGNLVKNIQHPDRFATSANWSPDGTKLASSSKNRKIYLWNAQTGALINTLFGHTTWVDSAIWSPDGTKLASCSTDGTRLWNAQTRLWNAQTGMQIGEPLTAHTNSINSLMTWSPNGTRLVSSSLDKNICVWNLENLLAKEKKLSAMTIEQTELFMEIASSLFPIILTAEQKKIFDSLSLELQKILQDKIVQLKQQKQTLIKRVAIATGIVAGGVFAWKCLSKK
jgi:WD40 repeat protein